MFMFRGKEIINIPEESVMAKWFEAFDLPKMPKNLDPFLDNVARDIETDSSLTEPVPHTIQYPVFEKDTVEILKGAVPDASMRHYALFGGIRNISEGFDKETMMIITRIIAMQLNNTKNELSALLASYAQVLEYAKKHKDLFSAVTVIKKKKEDVKPEKKKENVKSENKEEEDVVILGNKAVFTEDVKIVDAEFKSIVPVQEEKNNKEGGVWKFVNNKYLKTIKSFNDIERIGNTVEKFYDFLLNAKKSGDSFNYILDAIEKEGRMNFITKYSFSDDYFAIGKKNCYIFFYPEKDGTTGFEDFIGDGAEMKLKTHIKNKYGYNCDKKNPKRYQLTEHIRIPMESTDTESVTTVNLSAVMSYISNIMKSDKNLADIINSWKKEKDCDDRGILDMRLVKGERNFILSHAKDGVTTFIHFSPDGAKVYENITLQNLMDEIGFSKKAA